MIPRWLVLGGGDLKFLILLGMLEALVDRDPAWAPDGMVGTSAGGLLVGILAAKRVEGLSFLEAVQWTGAYVRREIRAPADLVTERRWWQRLAWPVQAVTGWRGLVSMAPLERRITRECRRAQDDPHAYVAVYDYRTRQTGFVSATPAHILASASVPIAAAAVGPYADGGVRDVVPTRLPRAHGARDIVVCKTQPAEVPATESVPRSLLGQALGAVGGMEREILANDVTHLDVAACQALTALAERGLSDKVPIRVRFAEARQRFPATIRRFTVAQRDELLAHGYRVGSEVFA